MEWKCTVLTSHGLRRGKKTLIGLCEMIDVIEKNSAQKNEDLHAKK